MGSDPVCAVTDCGNRDNTGRCTAAVGMFGGQPLACRYGQFFTIVRDHLGDLGEWKTRQYASDAAKATLRGANGTVEVWGGAHTREAWFIQRGTKAETQLCAQWSVTDGSLRDAVLEGCAMSGIQTRMEV